MPLSPSLSLSLSFYVIPEHEQLAGCRTLVLMLTSASIWDGMIKPNTVLSTCWRYSSCGGQLSALRNSEIKAYTNLEGEGICLQSEDNWLGIMSCISSDRLQYYFFLPERVLKVVKVHVKLDQWRTPMVWKPLFPTVFRCINPSARVPLQKTTYNRFSKFLACHSIPHLNMNIEKSRNE